MSVLQLIVFVCVYLCIMYMSVHQQSLTHVHAIMPAAMKSFVCVESGCVSVKAGWCGECTLSQVLFVYCSCCVWH